MFNAADLPALKEKLASPAYESDRAFLGNRKSKTKYGGPSIQAFRWQVFGDQAARDWAKRELLSGNIHKWGFPLDNYQWIFAWATTYDWLSDSLTPEERQQAWLRVKSRMGGNIGRFKSQKFGNSFAFNHNDAWGKGPAPYEAAVALAIYGDGVDDQLAEGILQRIVEKHRSFLSPYQMLDWLNIMALDSGGSQASHDTDNVTGYAGMYAYPCMLYHGYWESATGEDLWSQSNFFRYFPLWNTYDNDAPLRADGQAIMEVVAGRYQHRDPAMASLAAWYLQTYGSKQKSATFLLPRLIWGDKRVAAKTPEELQLPLALHLRGADCFVSRSSWDAEATVVNVATRTLDHLRYEPTPGVISMYRAGQPLLVDSRKGKWRREPVSASGIEIGAGVGSMYWKPPIQWQGVVTRPTQSSQVVGHPAYYADCLVDQQITDDYHSVTVRYDHLSVKAETDRAYRTVIHCVKPPELVVVIDHWGTNGSVDTLINWRLAKEPTALTEETFVWPGAAARVVTSSMEKLRWVGGVGHELEDPNGRWAGDKKSGFQPGYGSSAGRAAIMGIGNVYLAGTGSGHCLTVIAIGADQPPEVVRQGDGAYRFAGWDLQTGQNASFELTAAESQP